MTTTPSSFERKIEQGFLWIRDHQERFWTVLGIVFISILFGFFVFQQRNRQQNDAWDQLGIVQGQLMQNQIDTGRQSLEQWFGKFSGSSADSYAKFLKADLLYRTTDYSAAAGIYADLALSARPEVMQPLALSAQISAEEMAGKLTEARGTAQRFVEKYRDHFFTASAYLSLARLNEKLGDPAAAAAVYERFINLFPQSPWTESARNHLKALQGAKAKP